jgi:IMP dehydrogenase
MIIDPVTLDTDSLVIDAKNNMKKYKIGGIPIVSKTGKLVGIVTNRDLRFEKDNSKKLSEVMTSKNLITAKAGTSMTQAEKILQTHKIEKLPVVDSKGILIGLITFRDINKHSEKPTSNKDKLGRLMVSAAIGTDKDYKKRAQQLIKSGVDALVVDTAHAHSSRVGDVLKNLKDSFSEVDIVVGNIATADAANYLKENGADGIKVGIGPGSICTTRVVAGVGYPQLSAVLEVSEVLKNSKIPLIADGGIRYTGDISKAIAAGADSVMLGSLLAGTEESPGETIIYDGRKFKTYRGMGSVEAMQMGSKDRYFQSEEADKKKLVPEGIVGRVPYKGRLNESIHQFIGGLRSGMGYCGTKDIDTLKKSSKFVKITGSGIRESHPHNVSITKEAPNYSPPKI